MPTEHVHIKRNGKKYSWYKNPKNDDDTPRHNSDGGWKDVTKTMEKELRDAGVPEEYLRKKIKFPSFDSAPLPFEVPTLSTNNFSFDSLFEPVVGWWNGLSGEEKAYVICTTVLAIAVTVIVIVYMPLLLLIFVW